MHTEATAQVWGSEEALWSWFSSTMWLLGIKLKSAGLAVSAFPHGAILTALEPEAGAVSLALLVTGAWVLTPVQERRETSLLGVVNHNALLLQTAEGSSVL